MNYTLLSINTGQKTRIHIIYYPFILSVCAYEIKMNVTKPKHTKMTKTSFFFKVSCELMSLCAKIIKVKLF